MPGEQLRDGDVLARRYVLRERIGAGGMSVVWRAWDQTLERTVAVKVLDGPIGTDGGHRDLIRREARAAARIEHRNAIGVYDYGETVTPRGRIAAYVVMQLLDGVPLAGRLLAGPLPWPEAVAVAATVADVLHAAHRRGVVHRDVTPENVMLTTDGVKLLDFGIAADVGQREEPRTFGTPPYVAPERLDGAPASGATDVYALGVLLFEMLTGAPPGGATTWAELEQAAGRDRRTALVVPGLPPAVAAGCLRCLAPDPAERPTAAEVAAILETPAGRGRRRWLLAAVPIFAGVLAVLVVLYNRGAGTDHADPSVSIMVSIPPPVVLTPSPALVPPSARVGASRVGPPAGSAAASGPAGGPAGPSPVGTAPSRLTPEQAGQAVLEIIDRRNAGGEIRNDVAEDLRNQVSNLVANPDDAAKRIDNLHRALRDRQREHAVAPAAYDELDHAVTALGTALLPS